MIFYSIPISPEYLELLPVSALSHLVSAQNKVCKNQFHILDEEDQVVECTEEEQKAWLSDVEKCLMHQNQKEF